jgi:xylulokinase
VIIEQNPHAWWDLTKRAIELALDAAGADRRAVRGLAISSQGISFVLLDAAGRPLGNAINWLDSRATDECTQILARYPAEYLFRATGKRAAPYYVLPKLLWIRTHQPEVWRQARRVLMGHDYLVYRLCGEHVTDHSMAGGTLLYDLQGLDWSQELLDAFDIPRDLLPPVLWSGTPVGTLLPAVAEELGLPPDVVVTVGGQDQKCAALGAGIEDGCATVSLGTASAIEQIMARPRTDPQMRVPSFTFVLPGRWVLEGVVGTAAGSLRWYRDSVAPGVSYRDLDREAAGIAPGSAGVFFFPHLSGAGSPYWISNARGAFHGLNLAAGRAHLTRAVLEGVAYQIRANLAVTEEIAGAVERVILFGGGAKSDLWRAIIGDVTGRPVAWARTVETAGLGAAMLAGIGCGLFLSLADARERMLPPLAIRWPDADAAAVYAVQHEAYRRSEAALLGVEGYE